MVVARTYKAFRRNLKKKYGAKKKVYRKGRRATGTKKLVSLIKKVSLRNVETKHTHYLIENQNLNHNSGYLKLKLLETTQGVADTQSGTSFYASRLGDEVIARGLSIKLWLANKKDRPNVMYRIIVFKYQSLTTPTSSSIFVGANGNKMMDDIDKEYITPVYQKIINLNMATTQIIDASPWVGREPHLYKSFYIPLKNQKIKYTDGSTVPKFIDYGIRIIPYDSYGTLETDTIASMAFQYKFYFKDP